MPTPKGYTPRNPRTYLVWNGFAGGIEEAETHFHQRLRIAGKFQLEEFVEDGVEATENGRPLADPIQLIQQQEDRVILADFEVLRGELSGSQFPASVDPSVDPQHQNGTTLSEAGNRESEPSLRFARITH